MNQPSPAPEPPPLPAQLTAASFTHAVERLQVLETAISWVVLTGRYAYKIKKPVHLDFLDASTLGRRRFLCEEEVRLNRRFAPELYLDVQPIIRRDGRLQVGGEGTALEYAVRMRQFAGSAELTAQLAQGSVTADGLADLARRLADWHASAPRSSLADPYGSAELVRVQALDNFRTLRTAVAAQDAPRLQRLQARSEQLLSALHDLIEQRRSQGYVRECHGDLHAGNLVYWHGCWLPFDCLEFDPLLRWTDIMEDVAFLFMDLISRGHEALAYVLLTSYLEQGGDYAGLPLLALFSVYRALVRAKVDALAASACESSDHAADLRGRLQARLLTAERLAFRHAPALLLMHGVSGSGKSWLSGQLIGALGALRVRSDLERRRLLGAGAYSEPATAATYERLRACAHSALQGGYRIIVDATFLDRAERERFERLAEAHAAPWMIVSCLASPQTLAARIQRREHERTDLSEATPAILQAQLRSLEPLTAPERAASIPIDTDAPAPLLSALNAIRARLA